jgi:hypothetical protein
VFGGRRRARLVAVGTHRPRDAARLPNATTARGILVRIPQEDGGMVSYGPLKMDLLSF